MKKIYRFHEIREATGLSRVTIWRLERAGKFPQRIKLGDNSVGWFVSEVHQWIENRPRVGGEAVQGVS